MKRTLLILSAMVLGFGNCPAGNPKVAARFVPEREDDFVFENNLIAGRIYGKSLESCGKGQITSPGIDVWVKIPGGLVADKRYHDELVNNKTYHKDWGNGKDCYKVGRSLGAGASSPIADSELCLPATNYRSWEILEKQDDKVVFVLRYPEWTMKNGVKVALEKTFTVIPDTYFVKCEDCYTFEGAGTITVAAGVNRHHMQGTLVDEEFGKDRYSLWERASDTGAEPEEGLIGIGVILPDCESVRLTADESHAVCCKSVKSGEKLTYWFGFCWTKGDVKDFDSWKELVHEQHK